MKRNNKKGFTIVELVIVIAVIAILAGVLIPTFAGVVNKANESKALQEAKNAYTADLAMLDGQVKANVAKDSVLGYAVTKDTTVVTGKTYYTENEGAYVEVTPAAGSNPSTSNYYEATYVFAGTFTAPDANGDYTYTYEKDNYTCKYDTTKNKWSVEKKSN